MCVFVCFLFFARPGGSAGRRSPSGSVVVCCIRSCVCVCFSRRFRVLGLFCFPPPPIRLAGETAESHGLFYSFIFGPEKLQRISPDFFFLSVVFFFLFFSRRMLRLVAENAALEDALYYLDLGVTDSVISVEVFLKEIRRLARKQFVARATMKKVIFVHRPGRPASHLY